MDHNKVVTKWVNKLEQSVAHTKCIVFGCREDLANTTALNLSMDKISVEKQITGYQIR